MTQITKSGTKDSVTNAAVIVDYTHKEIHNGDYYTATHSVADIGAATTPDDAITITFNTPNTTKWAHMIAEFKAVGGALCTIREGGADGASPTGNISCVNRNRNSANTSGLTDLTPTAGQLSYDATLDTGGTLIYNDYIPGANTATSKVGGSTEGGARHEWILKQNTRYQISIVSTANVAASITLNWYEHTSIA